ncbi:MAG: cytochrome d ubiquinol oxidase subunit II, partial [Acidobacteria bacterium]|nr:cytochrome d ubiquinol oxidase subunit II [Acidobacteriota bacterium]
MEMLWFWIAAVMVAVYVVMDGFDFGAGALHLAVAKSDRERRQVLAAIGPFWDGNEVWLLAGGGVLFLAFPKVLASGLSGFYLAIMLVLWVLILRGISIEFRSHVGDGMWRGFWDGVFFLASTLAPVLFGAALGNLLRGVPLDGDGWFALPLFESFSPTGALGILDWYTVLAGVFALVAILHHGALFLAWKTDGAVHARSRLWAGRLFPVTIVVWIAATAATASVAPEVFSGIPNSPLAWVGTCLGLTGIVASFIYRRAG